MGLVLDALFGFLWLVLSWKQEEESEKLPVIIKLWTFGVDCYSGYYLASWNVTRDSSPDFLKVWLIEDWEDCCRLWIRVLF